MNTNDTLERMVTDRLASDAAGYDSDRALDDALAVTSRMRPYSQWLALMKEPPMRIPSRVVVGSPTLRLATILALTLALALALAGAVAGAASLLPSEPVPAPFGPARNGPLAYARDGDIHLVDTDGTNDRVIIAGPEVDADPWFSYLGDRLFFVRNREAAPQIWMARPDGSDPRMLLEHDVTLFEHLPGRDQIVVRSTESTTISIVDLGTGGVVTEVDLGGPEPTGWIMARPPGWTAPRPRPSWAFRSTPASMVVLTSPRTEPSCTTRPEHPPRPGSMTSLVVRTWCSRGSLNSRPGSGWRPDAGPIPPPRVEPRTWCPRRTGSPSGCSRCTRPPPLATSGSRVSRGMGDTARG